MALAPEEVGARIETARKAKGWTHQDLADQIGEALGRRVNLRTVQRWQKGRDPRTGKPWLPKLQTLTVLADVLEVPSSYFVENSEPDEGGAFADRLLAVERSQAENSESLAALRRIEEQNQVLLSELVRRIRGDEASDQAT